MTTLGKHVHSFTTKYLSRFGRFVNKDVQYHTSAPRYLFSGDILGIENYKRQRALAQDKIGDLKEKFRGRMEEYMETATKNTIFTDDLRTIVYVADNEQDVATTEKMITRFHGQTRELRFSNFVFGPLVMRMFHMLNLPEKAYQLFVDEELSGFFDQMSSYVVLMDLLFESGHYQEVIDVLQRISDKQLLGFKYPVDCVTICLAACLKLNTEESYQKMLNILQEVKQASGNVTMRGIVYAALLALKQGDASTALEILSMGNDNRPRLPVAHSNVKALTYASLGRPEDALQILRAVLDDDSPDHVRRGNEIFREVVDKVGQSVSAADNVELSRLFERIENGLQQGNHIAEAEFEDYIFRPIIRRRQLQDGYQSRRRGGVGGYRQSSGRKAYRPGLRDREDKLAV